MVNYKNLLHTRSGHAVNLVKFLLDVNEINYIVENEHLICYNPSRNINVKVEEEKIGQAQDLINDLPRRLRNVK